VNLILRTMIYRLARPALFLLDPERALALTLRGVQLLGKLAASAGPSSRPVPLMGLSFVNRVGLAAGCDKNGTAVDGWFALGFGHIEVGTVTPRPQSGAPKPRVFRLNACEGLINRMGFPSEGVERVVARLRWRRRTGVVGVNIGKNATTPLERAIDDYVFCLRAVFEVADYVVVNVSSPNTAGLRTLQGIDHLVPLLSALREESLRLETRYSRRVPLLLKLSPDLSEGEFRSAAAVVATTAMAGIVATNTTLTRDGTEGDPVADEPGGLSGRPLFPKSLKAVRILRRALGPHLALIAVGGVASPEDARLLSEAGADLIQLYTSLVYQGPRLVQSLAHSLCT
jgi:dihydroorotate dehydrogenase